VDSENAGMQPVTTIGLDIAKSLFQVNGVYAQVRQLKRRQILAFIGKPILRVRDQTVSDPHIVGCVSFAYWVTPFGSRRPLT
jgi:hypothetical protein